MAKIRYTRDGDGLVIKLSDRNIDHAEVAGQFIVHVSVDDEVVEIEVLDAREFVMGALASVVEEREVTIHEEQRSCGEAAQAYVRSIMASEHDRTIHSEYQTSHPS